MRTRISGLIAAVLVAAACGGGSADTTTTSEPPTTTTTDVETTTTANQSTTTAGDTTTTSVPADPYTFEIVIDGSEVTGGGRISVPLGETVTLRIASDVDDEVHIHGYDIYVDLVAGTTIETSFVADIPGVVELETHDGGLVLATLEAS